VQRADLTRVRAAFAGQAESFEDPRLGAVFGDGAAWLLERLPLRPDDLALDVAAGTGRAARSLAPRVRAVVAVDATPEMLARGRAAAREEGRANIVFQQGDAVALPFLAGSFDVVVCRLALHHMDDPAAAVAEMRRCLRPGGRLLLADLVAHPDPAVAAEQNRLERLRDPSHARALDAQELARLAGTDDVVARTIERPLEPWLAQTSTPPEAAAAIRTRLEAEPAGGPPTGFRPRRDGDALLFSQTLASCLGRV
jgi:SAM-dependent methyltransferase